MDNVENHMVVDEIWEESKPKQCKRCGYTKSLCECFDERD